MYYHFSMRWYAWFGRMRLFWFLILSFIDCSWWSWDIGIAAIWLFIFYIISITKIEPYAVRYAFLLLIRWSVLADCFPDYVLLEILFYSSIIIASSDEIKLHLFKTYLLSNQLSIEKILSKPSKDITVHMPIYFYLIIRTTLKRNKGFIWALNSLFSC